MCLPCEVACVHASPVVVSMIGGRKDQWERRAAFEVVATSTSGAVEATAFGVSALKRRCLKELRP